MQFCCALHCRLSLIILAHISLSVKLYASFSTSSHDDMTLLHVTIMSQTRKRIVHWTQLLRACPLHGCGAEVRLSNRTGREARVLILEWPKLLVRGCNTVSALTSKSHYRCSWDEMMTGRCGLGAYAELACWAEVFEVADAQTAPITMVGASLDAVRLDKIIYAVLLTKTEGKAFSIVYLTPR